MAEKIDDRVLQVRRAKQADKYEKCFRSIHKYVARALKDDTVGIGEMYHEVMERIGKVYPSPPASPTSRARSA